MFGSRGIVYMCYLEFSSVGLRCGFCVVCGGRLVVIGLLGFGFWFVGLGVHYCDLVGF